MTNSEVSAILAVLAIAGIGLVTWLPVLAKLLR